MPNYRSTPVWSDSDIPAGWMGSYHVGNGVFRQRCRECSQTWDSEPGTGAIMRYHGIGPHEVEAHGLTVPGINVGILA